MSCSMTSLHRPSAHSAWASEQPMHCTAVLCEAAKVGNRLPERVPAIWPGSRRADRCLGGPSDRMPAIGTLPRLSPAPASLPRRLPTCPRLGGPSVRRHQHTHTHTSWQAQRLQPSRAAASEAFFSQASNPPEPVKPAPTGLRALLTPLSDPACNARHA